MKHDYQRILSEWNFVYRLLKKNDLTPTSIKHYCRIYNYNYPRCYQHYIQIKNMPSKNKYLYIKKRIVYYMNKIYNVLFNSYEYKGIKYLLNLKYSTPSFVTN